MPQGDESPIPTPRFEKACANCREALSVQAEFCTRCGHREFVDASLDEDQETPGETPWYKTLGIILLLVLGLATACLIFGMLVSLSKRLLDWMFGT
ncbi:MAG: hypothetical protein AB7N71_06885 [Phycisphaerae bacterium]